MIRSATTTLTGSLATAPEPSYLLLLTSIAIAVFWRRRRVTTVRPDRAWPRC